MKKYLFAILVLVSVFGLAIADPGTVTPMVVKPPIPEPISASLFLLGAAGLGLRFFSRKK